MNAIRFTLLSAVVIGAFLYVVDARRPLLLKRYARFVMLGLVAAAFLTPFAWIACASFKSTGTLFEYNFLPPFSQWAQDLTFDSFRKLFEPKPSLHGDISFGQYFLNTVFLSSAATVIQVFFCSLGGYALAKYRFTGRHHLMLFMLGSMTLPGQLFLAPMFQLMVQIDWIDSYAALLVPGAVSAFGLFLFRQAMLGVPDSLIEAARVDGASEFRIYLRVVMPLVKPMTAAFCLIVFLGQWNNFLGPQIFLQSNYKLTLSVILTQYITQFGDNYGVFVAGTLLSILPIAALFLALQREFIAGLTSGAVKG